MTDVLTPNNSGETIEAIRQSLRDGGSLLPCGNRSRIDRHDLEASPSNWLSMSRLNQIVDIQPDDLTCTLQPGVTAGQLDEALKGFELELGTLSPNQDSGTLGGLFLAPDLSLLRHRYGPPRDQILGGKWILADATPVITGAKVVKSVAGYDVTRLFLGSRGRLAACTELTVRLRSRPREIHALSLSEPDLIANAGFDEARVLVFEGQPFRGWAIFEHKPNPNLPGDRVDPEEACQGLDSAIQTFSTAPFRLHVKPSKKIPIGLSPIAWDPLGGQIALATPPQKNPEGSHLVPPHNRSPWLEKLAEACAPGVKPFGEARNV